jgi:hypothetical protein
VQLHGLCQVNHGALEVAQQALGHPALVQRELVVRVHAVRHVEVRERAMQVAHEALGDPALRQRERVERLQRVRTVQIRNGAWEAATAREGEGR